MRGQVPTARVAPIIALLIRERWPQGGGYEVLAEKVGCDEGAVRGIAEQRSDGAEFNLVDQILCSLGRPDFWWGELADIYYNLDLKGNPRGYVPKGYRRCERRGCGELFQPNPRAPKVGKKVQRFCCTTCAKIDSQHRLQGTKVVYGPGRRLQRMACKRGIHDFTPENTYTYPDGRIACRTCLREKNRKYAARKRARLKEAALAA